MAMFFDEISFPEEWNKLSDEELLKRYADLTSGGQAPNRKAQLLICFLMKRHKAAIVLVTKKYIKSVEDFEDFVHDLYEKLLRVLPGNEPIKNFGGFLFTLINRMHLDAIKKKKPDVGIDNLSPPSPGNLWTRSVDLRMDYPLDEAGIKKLISDGILSPREGIVIIYLSLGYKPREMVDLISDEFLGIKPQTPPLEDAKKAKIKVAKIYSAIERARKKLNDHFGRSAA
ncbi:MAG: sigma-70 family RNA polymerase sigma factor [Bacteroidota bacterium]